MQIHLCIHIFMEANIEDGDIELGQIKSGYEDKSDNNKDKYSYQSDSD